MKKILVIDESQAVRETLGLILRRDFVVLQRSSSAKDALAFAGERVDLLILGISPGLEGESALLKIASQAPCPVLFLVDSKPAVDYAGGQRQIDCLVKPFNPYELKEKVVRLLARPQTRMQLMPQPPLAQSKNIRYLDYPHIPAPVAALAKRFALTPLSLLMLGESGCGQEKIARALYELNSRAGLWLSAYSRDVNREHLHGQMAELRRREGDSAQRITLFLSGLESLAPSGQSSLLAFLEAEEERGAEFWILSSSRVDLLERVYGGEFLDHLYYRLAKLVLRLPPLRERQADLPALAVWLAEEYGERLNLGKVSLSPAAIDRLCHYLWFGNVDEMEAVIARTLATHRKKIIDAPELVLDIPGLEEQLLRSPISERRSVSEGKSRKEPAGAPSAQEKELPGASGFGSGDSPEMKVLISELAHELKNPMVTIKTFAHLLGERFDDAAFRVRFQETVSSDIQRMDDVLEALLDFSRFSQPVVEPIFIHEQLRRVEEELLPDCIKREASLQWGKKGENLAVLADKAQFLYAFKNLLRTVLSQVKPKSEIEIDVEEGGGVAVSYVREGGGLSTFAHYLDLEGEEASPLRILLARILLERNGGGIKISQLDGGRVLIKAELPVV